MHYDPPMNNDAKTILSSTGLRDTQPRRMVLRVLMKDRSPHSHRDIYESIQKSGGTINLVTVYRILQQFLESHIIHLHPTTGRYVLCTEDGNHQCHSFMTCERCGGVEEFHDEKLCSEEHRIAEKSGFSPRYHVSDVVGVCARCQ